MLTGERESLTFAQKHYFIGKRWWMMVEGKQNKFEEEKSHNFEEKKSTLGHFEDFVVI